MIKSNHITEVFCTLQIEGTHAWYQCPFDEVSYLRDPHRHVFFIKAFKRVDHDDRDCEFIMLKHAIKKYLNEQYNCKSTQLHVFGSMSCEMIGRELLEKFDLSRIEVSEDNENGSIITSEGMIC